jgi:hypothetical protein
MNNFHFETKFQCNIDQRLQATKKASDRLKQLNMMAAEALTAKIATSTTYTKNANIYSKHNDCYFVDRSYKSEFIKHQSTKSLLTRRHTIQSMTRATTTPPSPPSSKTSFRYANNFDIHYAKHINLDNQLKTSLRAPTSPTLHCHDSKAYVGSFNQVKQFHQFLLPMHHHLSNVNVNTKEEEETEEDNNNDLKQVNNNFNNDFYRLCSGGEILENESSENNLNYLCQAKGNANGYKCQSNLTNHVNTLFDQWLSNSSHSSPIKNNVVKQKPKINQ